MIRTYFVDENETRPFISAWDGETYYYTIFESEYEKQKELKRLEKIEREWEEAKKRIREIDLY